MSKTLSAEAPDVALARVALNTLPIIEKEIEFRQNGLDGHTDDCDDAYTSHLQETVSQFYESLTNLAQVMPEGPSMALAAKKHWGDGTEVTKVAVSMGLSRTKTYNLLNSAIEWYAHNIEEIDLVVGEFSRRAMGGRKA